MNERDQKAFMAALMNADGPVPAGLAHPGGGDAADRMAIYRNNVAYSLMTVLGDAFPLLANLLGRETFTQLSRAFILAHPPGDPRMFRYGETLPAFLTDDDELAHVPYAADVARLEVAMQQVSHAADDAGLSPVALAEGAIENERLSFVSATQIVSSSWPLHDLYLYVSSDAPPPPDMAQAQSVLVYRDADYQLHIAKLAIGCAALLADMMSGTPLAQAAEAADRLDEAGMVEVFSLKSGKGTSDIGETGEVVSKSTSLKDT